MPTKTKTRTPASRTASLRSGELVRLPDSRFTYENASEYNRVFLWENIETPPFMRPVAGWKIVGFGKAPWPGSTDGYAVMLEKVTPAEKQGIFGKHEKTFEEGTRIWQHGREEWVPGQPGYERRMRKSNIASETRRGQGQYQKDGQ